MKRSDERTTPDTSTAGFSLVELLVVLAIIGMIAGLAVPQVLRYLGSARSDTAATQIKSIKNALELYYLDNRSYPSDAEGLQALAARPAGATRWNGPYLKNADGLDDPWGRPYLYKRSGDGAGVVVSSLGRDGRQGGEGEDADIVD